ncbi:hypothetical protein [Deinococcus kurensis]|uniref:hypothetical protein n=1 Tax=Deinococcus kurensis TaxID=2662757 RepID=UPI0012D3510C|nr:hypothetical protein [Deinococcus kurensis]
MIVTTPSFRVVLFTNAHGQNDLRAFRDLTRALIFEASLTAAQRPNAAHVIACEEGRSPLIEEHAVWSRWDAADQADWYAEPATPLPPVQVSEIEGDEADRL